MILERRKKRLKQVLERRQLDLHIVIENVHDRFNASAVMRTADGLGIQNIHLLYTKEDFPEISKEVSSSSKKWLTFNRWSDRDKLVKYLKEQDLEIIATNLDSSADKYTKPDWTQSAAIILGNEHRGVSEEMLERSDREIYIPMEGMVQSFNITVSAGIILGEAHKQRTKAGLYKPEWSDKKADIYSDWLEREEELK